MKCNNCGAQVDGNSCPYCGASLQTDTNDSSSEQATLNETKAAPTAKNKMKKPIYKKWWFWVIAAILLMNIIGRIGGNNNSNKPKEFVWSNMELSDMLPKPESTLGELAINSKECLSIDVHNISETQYKDYVNSCRNKGFTIDVEEYETTFTSKNETGYKLMLYYFESDKEMSIDLTAPNDSAEKAQNDNDSTNAENTKKAEEVNKIFAEDAVVNRFISEFNSNTKYDMSEISKGNIKTKYFAHANDCYIEIINANDADAKCFSVSINGGQETSDRDRMFDVFAEIVKVLDSSLTDDKVIEAVNHLKSEKYMVSDYIISDSVTVETYVPIVELSYGKNPCRIDVIANNYK